MRTILMTMALAITAGAQIAGPVEVNGVKLGSSLAEWQSGPGAACSSMSGGKPGVVRFMCRNATYAGIAVNEMVSFYDGRLESFLLMVPRNSSTAVRAALTQKYGQPAKKDQVKGPLMGDISEWSDDQTTISLNEAGGMGPNAVLSFFDKAIAKAQVTGAKLNDTADNAQPAQSATGAQPYEVKGVKLGTPLAQWRSGPGAACRAMDNDDPSEVRFKCSDQTYAGVPVDEMITFYDGRLSSFYLVTTHDNFIVLRDALTTKFGPPKEKEQKTFSERRTGHTQDGQHHMWDSGVSTIDLVEFAAGDFDHSAIAFMHTGVIAEHNKKTKAKTDDM